MSQRLRTGSCDLKRADEAEITSWLAGQDTEEAVWKIAQTLRPILGATPRPSPQTLCGSFLLAIAFVISFILMYGDAPQYPIQAWVWYSVAGLYVVAVGLIVASPPFGVLGKRQTWLRKKLTPLLESGGRHVSLGGWIRGVDALQDDQRRFFDTLAHRLATATQDELQALTAGERTWLRARLTGRWPGEALQVAVLLSLGTVGDATLVPYAQKLVASTTETATVREAAAEYLHATQGE